MPAKTFAPGARWWDPYFVAPRQQPGTLLESFRPDAGHSIRDFLRLKFCRYFHVSLNVSPISTPNCHRAQVVRLPQASYCQDWQHNPAGDCRFCWTPKVKSTAAAAPLNWKSNPYFSRATTKSGIHSRARLYSLSGNSRRSNLAASAYSVAFPFAYSIEP